MVINYRSWPLREENFFYSSFTSLDSLLGIIMMKIYQIILSYELFNRLKSRWTPA